MMDDAVAQKASFSADPHPRHLGHTSNREGRHARPLEPAMPHAGRRMTYRLTDFLKIDDAERHERGWDVEGLQWDIDWLQS